MSSWDFINEVKQLSPALGHRLHAAIDAVTHPAGTSIEAAEIPAIIVSAGVDNFNASLHELIRGVIRERPDVAIAEFKKGGLYGLLSLLARELSISVDLSQDVRRQADEILAIRNLFVHRRGIVDDEYLRRSRRNDVQLGQLVRISADSVIPYLELLRAVRSTVADSVKTHFNARISKGSP